MLFSQEGVQEPYSGGSPVPIINLNKLVHRHSPYYLQHDHISGRSTSHFVQGFLCYLGRARFTVFNEMTNVLSMANMG